MGSRPRVRELRLHTSTVEYRESTMPLHAMRVLAATIALLAQPGTAPRTPPRASEPSLSSLLKRSGSDKANHHAYDVVYEGLFAPFRDRPIRMLEIGVEDGHSLDVWSKYFASGSKIFGLAYNNTLKENLRDNVTIFHGSQGDASVLDRLVGAGNFSIIIDDGSHLPSHQWNTFQTLWNTVTPGGVYVVEDIETNYWSKNAVVYGYPLRHEKNAMDDFKRLVDTQVNAEFSRGVDDTDMQWIQFYKNCVIIKKHGLGHSKRTYRWARSRLPAEALRTASSIHAFQGKSHASRVDVEAHSERKLN